MSPSSCPAGPGGSGAAGVGPGAHQGQQRPRRLSRVVKCRTVDFTEFPEGMRDYARNGKRLLREIQSQPGSPTLIPRIEIHDFGSEVQPILFYFIFCYYYFFFKYYRFYFVRGIFLPLIKPKQDDRLYGDLP